MHLNRRRVARALADMRAGEAESTVVIVHVLTPREIDVLRVALAAGEDIPSDRTIRNSRRPTGPSANSVANDRMREGGGYDR